MGHVWYRWCAAAVVLSLISCGGGEAKRPKKVGSTSGTTTVASPSDHGTTNPPPPPPPAPATDGDEATYSNGHPLRTATTDTTILSLEEETYRLVNDYRVSRGLSSLIMHDRLRKIARAHSKHMVVHDFMSHDNPEGDDPFERMTRNGMQFSAAAENLAAGSVMMPQDAVQGWLNSPSHKANIERAYLTHTGLGFWGGSATYRRYYTQKFATNPQ